MILIKKDNEKLHKIPPWLLQIDDARDAKSGRGGGTGFIRRTLAGISGVLMEDLLAERYASKKLFLQTVDPRLKLASIIALLVLTGLLKSPVSLAVLASAAFILAVLSGLEARTFITRVWFVIPLFVMVLSIPAATDLVIPGEPVLRLPWGICLTREGILAVLRTVLRTGVSLSFCYLLVMTTRWSHLTASLRAFRVPKLFTAILDMTYRFIFVLVKASIEIFEARYLRTVGKIENRQNRRFVAGGMAFLFAKSSHMSEEIYEAMLGRCYVGEPAGRYSFGLSRNDLVWAVDLAVIILVALLF